MVELSYTSEISTPQGAGLKRELAHYDTKSEAQRLYDVPLTPFQAEISGLRDIADGHFLSERIKKKKRESEYMEKGSRN